MLQLNEVNINGYGCMIGSLRKFWLMGVAASLSVFVILSSSQAWASIAQGYVSRDGELTTGMAAAYSGDGQETLVVRTNGSNSDKFVGIVTTETSNLVTLKNEQSNVIITTSGEAVAYVSDLNGEIRHGDYLVASPLQGILVKAALDDSFVLATALEDFQAEKANTTTVETVNNESKTTKITAIKINVGPQKIGDTSPKTLSFLQVIGEGIIGRTINSWQVATVLIIFLLLLVVEGSLMYGAIHGTIIALGRNPMAREAVYRQLFQAVITVAIVFVFGAAIIYTVIQI